MPRNETTIARILEEWASRANVRLHQLLEMAQDGPPALVEAMRYSLLGPGKRLRPCLTVLAAQACGGPAEAALSAGCAIEMIHTYSLVHDDLPAMDDDDLRRGLPTCHRKFGEAMAILVGDGLQALAFQVLASEYPPRVAASACRELAIAAGPVGMVGGQVDDLSWEGRIDAGRNIDPDIDHLERIHLRKTGALFGACLRIGQIVAEMAPPDGVDIAKRRCLDDYGRCLGLLFQITDDLLDANGSEAATGKRVGKDAARGKLTYPGLLGIDESRRRAESVAAGAIAAIQPLGANADPLGNLVVALISRDR